MSTYSVNVSNISSTTTDANLKDFFTFCGKITSINHNTSERTAVIHFEKASAAKTALMLNGGTLDGEHLTVTSDSVQADSPDHHEEPHHDVGSSTPYEQSDKPRAGIAAEYLAKGYTLSDSILQRAIEIDSNQGISKRFVSYLQSLDTNLGSRVVGPEKTISGKVSETFTGAQAKAREVDEQKGFSKTAGDYYSKALAHPLGQKVLSFYTLTTKTVTDIHEEARRIADHHKVSGTTGTAAAAPQADEKTSSAEAVAPSAPGA